MYDVIIVGAGPAGASAAIFAKKAGLKTLLLEKSFSQEIKYAVMLYQVKVLG